MTSRKVDREKRTDEMSFLRNLSSRKRGAGIQKTEVGSRKKKMTDEKSVARIKD